MPRVGAAFVWAHVRGCACTRMCVMRVVMNKDVLCVELVVNHWQRWQLTDRQIDPRPPRERCLASAHSSHTHATPRTHTHTLAQSTFWAQRLSEGLPKGLSFRSSLTIYVNICESYQSTQPARTKERRGNERQRRPGRSWQHLQPLPWLLTCESQPGICYSVESRTQIKTNTHLWPSRRRPYPASPPWGHGDWGAEGGTDGRTDGWMDCGGEDRMTGWQNRVKDTLQYYVTAWQAHQGPRELRGRRGINREEKKKKARGQTSVVSFWLPTRDPWWEKSLTWRCKPHFTCFTC